MQWHFVVVGLLGIVLSGCGTGNAVPSKIKLPPARYMDNPKRCPVPPKSAKMNKSARDHAAKITRNCAINGQDVRGLQSHALTVSRRG